MEISAEPDQLKKPADQGLHCFSNTKHSYSAGQYYEKYDHAMKIPKTAKCSDDNGKLGLGT